MQKITPCLWFDGNAEEAVAFYSSVFKRSKTVEVMRYGEAGPGRAGDVMMIVFELEGQRFSALNGGPQFEFTPAISFYVDCPTQAEIDELYGKLLAGGGREMQCGWVTDRFGVSWQIVPSAIGELIADPRAMKAMMQMKKLDIAQLEAAARR